MTDKKMNIQDEQQLIDLLLGTCDDAQAQQLKDRLAAEPELATTHAELAKVFDVLATDETPQAPTDLVSRTLEHIESQARLDALLADEKHGKPAQPNVWRRVGRSLAIAACLVLLVSAVVRMTYQTPGDNGGGNNNASMITGTRHPVHVPTPREPGLIPVMPEYNDTVTHVIGLRDPATGQVRVFILQPIDVDSQAMPDELNMDHLFQRTD
jgi:hypothetical protein